MARDLNSGALVYANVGAWELGELLGLDWEDAPAEWSYTSLAARLSLSDAGYDCPYAENLQLLKGMIPDDRYAELQVLVEAPPAGKSEEDLPLTDEEIELLEKQYAEAKAPDALGLGLARTELVATDGTILHFEVVIGDAGELEDPKGPYEFEQGEFLDTSEWIEVDLRGHTRLSATPATGHCNRAAPELGLMRLTLELHPVASQRVQDGGAPHRVSDAAQPGNCLGFSALVAVEKVVCTERGDLMQLDISEDETAPCQARSFSTPTTRDNDHSMYGISCL
ncbi:MAG TPA: hypothetical protein VN436_06020 [Holophaga sp.]|nr:hypothetical protein [Holophaga sp.]